MSTSVKIYRQVLDVQSDKLTLIPLTTKNKRNIFPATKTLLRTLRIKEELIDEWEKAREFKKLDIRYSESLREYQKEGINKILQLNRVAIFDQQRLGKTPMVLNSLLYRRDVNKTLIIAPKSLLYNWNEECKKWYCNRIAVVSGEKRKRESLYKNKKYNVYITSYTTLVNDTEIVPEFDCVIIDEAHRLRNYKSMTSKSSPKTVKAIMKVTKNIKYKYALTGTPAPNKSENIFPILHFLYPELFTSYYKFIDYYYETESIFLGKGVHIEQPSCFRCGKEKELIEFLDYISLQRKRIDYMDWLPPVDKKIINLNLDNKEKKWYNDIALTFECEELNISCENKLTQMIALRSLVCKSAEKRDYILDYIKDYPDENIMIVSQFTTYLKELSEIIKKKGYKTDLLIGDTPQNKRHEIQIDFNKKKIKILLCNIDVVKEGMKLEACNTIFFLDKSLTYTDNEQLEDRLLPTSKEVAVKKDKQQIITLIVNETVDNYIDNMLKRKASSVDIINNFAASVVSQM